jgi:hypothetical protein
MKFDVEDDFVADYRRLTNEERELFRQVIRQINEVYAQRGNRPMPQWPASLRVRRMSDTPGVWELTWSFSGPDGRATFSLRTVDGEVVLKWRRIGDHRIFSRP